MNALGSSIEQGWLCLCSGAKQANTSETVWAAAAQTQRQTDSIAIRHWLVEKSHSLRLHSHNGVLDGYERCPQKDAHAHTHKTWGHQEAQSLHPSPPLTQLFVPRERGWFKVVSIKAAGRGRLSWGKVFHCVQEEKSQGSHKHTGANLVCGCVCVPE